VTGTLGLLLKAKSLALIPGVRPFVDRLLREGGWFDPELVRRVLEQAGE
jgi:predicted nucleic acid-binding protein